MYSKSAVPSSCHLTIWSMCFITSDYRVNIMGVLITLQSWEVLESRPLSLSVQTAAVQHIQTKDVKQGDFRIGLLSMSLWLFFPHHLPPPGALWPTAEQEEGRNSNGARETSTSNGKPGETCYPSRRALSSAAWGALRDAWADLAKENKNKPSDLLCMKALGRNMMMIWCVCTSQLPFDYRTLS